MNIKMHSIFLLSFLLWTWPFNVSIDKKSYKQENIRNIHKKSHWHIYNTKLNLKLVTEKNKCDWITYSWGDSQKKVWETTAVPMNIWIICAKVIKIAQDGFLREKETTQ